MLTPELVEALQVPINGALPCGEDLEYDAAFNTLAVIAQGKPEQQFGDTVIAAVEPEWRQVAEQSHALLRRSKDVRAAVLMLRAATRLDGVAGFASGLQLLHGLLDRFWEGIHPKLDADEDNDPTMRLNALAPLTDESMVPLDLYDAQVGVSRSAGPIRVRDIAIAHNALAAPGSEPTFSVSQIQGALEEIHASRPDTLRVLLDLRGAISRLQQLLADRTGRDDAVDLDRLKAIAAVLHKAGALVSPVDAAAGEPVSSAHVGNGAQAASHPAAPRGEISNRQDAIDMLDRVIRYLTQAEPGNPAPLLIERAKKLIGVSFLEIMADLAPNAMDTIENVTGKRPSE